MRSLTTVESSKSILSEIEFQLTASDQSTTWIFPQSDLVAPLPTISWKVDFGGGLGKTSNYNITISSSLGFIKDNLSNFAKGETKLKVTVNSDAYYPHFGRIRSFQRDSRDPNKIEFSIYDKFLDDNPNFPPVSLQDSYANLHPEVLNSNWSYPIYYGRHHRPFYHVPVDCSVATLLSAQNISSENHVNSVWYTNDTTNVLSNSNLFLATKVWSQNDIIKTDSTGMFAGNIMTANFPVHDVGNNYSKLIEFSGTPITLSESSNGVFGISSYTTIHSSSNVLNSANAVVDKFVASVDSDVNIGKFRDYHP